MYSTKAIEVYISLVSKYIYRCLCCLITFINPYNSSINHKNPTQYLWTPEAKAHIYPAPKIKPTIIQLFNTPRTYPSLQKAKARPNKKERNFSALVQPAKHVSPFCGPRKGPRGPLARSRAADDPCLAYMFTLSPPLFMARMGSVGSLLIPEGA